MSHVQDVVSFFNYNYWHYNKTALYYNQEVIKEVTTKSFVKIIKECKRNV